MLNHAGLAMTLPYLENLTACWQTSNEPIRSSLWREEDELSGRMLRSWPPERWREEGNNDAGRMLDL